MKGVFSTFGLSCSDWPWLLGFFTRVVKNWFFPLSPELFDFWFFMDYWLFFAGSREKCSEQAERFLSLLPGWIHFSPGEVCPLFVYLGRVVDTWCSLCASQVRVFRSRLESIIACGRTVLLHASSCPAPVGVLAHSEPSFFG